jgi:hypothetical protein
MLIIGALTAVSSHAQSLRQILMQADNTLRNVRIIPCQGSPELFIAVLVTEDHWWETISFIRFKNHQIISRATIDKLPEAQSIYAAREIFLKGFRDPMIEVFDITHMGNGFYYLYRLHGSRASLLLQTFAVDRNRDGAEHFGDSLECSRVFKHDRLTPSYKDLNNDGYADIRLTGIAQLYAQDDKTLLRQWPVQKVFLYDTIRRRFIEEHRKRIGI